VLNFVLQYAGLVLALNELLETRFVPDNPSCSTPLGQSLRGTFEHHNAGNFAHRDFEINKIAFLVQHLRTLKEKEPALLTHYRREFQRAGETDSYFGVRFEVATIAALLDKGVRPIKGERPDLCIPGGDVAIECTSARVRSVSAKAKPHTKLWSTITQKSQQPYSNRSTALFVDVTNMAFYSKPFDPDEYRAATVATNEQNNFGATLLFVTMMNKLLERYETNYLRIDHPRISPSLHAFLDAQYPSGTHRVGGRSIPYEA
jgi:hypothetical protein